MNTLNIMFYSIIYILAWINLIVTAIIDASPQKWWATFWNTIMAGFATYAIVLHQQSVHITTVFQLFLVVWYYFSLLQIKELILGKKIIPPHGKLWNEIKGIAKKIDDFLSQS